MSDRVQQFSESMGMAVEEARAWVEPLAGLTDEQFTAHASYLAARKVYICEQERSLAPAAVQPSPATDVATVRDQIAEFMIDFLDAEEQVPDPPASLRVDDLGVADEIARHFADLDESAEG